MDFVSHPTKLASILREYNAHPIRNVTLVLVYPLEIAQKSLVGNGVLRKAHMAQPVQVLVNAKALFV